MKESYQQNKIVVCMGSSCFSRGNNKNLEVIKNYLKTNNIEHSVVLTGVLCEDMCSIGPNIRINDKLFNSVATEKLVEILDNNLKQKNK